MHILDKNIVSILLERFPKNNIKFLQYNNSNKLLFDNLGKYYVLKPKGRKSYLWFTYFKKELLTILIIQNSKNIHDNSNEFYKINVKYDNTLCYNNVLLQGLYFKKKIYKSQLQSNSNSKSNSQSNSQSQNYNVLNYFVLDNVLNYNIFNSIILRNDFNHILEYKLALFSNIMPKIYCNSSGSNDFKINLPIILDNNNDIFKLIYNIDYELYCINIYSEYKYLGNFILNTNNNTNNNNNNNNNNTNNNNNKLLATFKITPCINQDLYNLFIKNDSSNEQFYDLALIDSYKTSVFMNKLFRYIKENKNLDYLEESDSEEEFENIDENKFTNINKSLFIECEYNYKFKKWMPRKISKESLVNKKYLDLIINKKKYIYNV